MPSLPLLSPFPSPLRSPISPISPISPGSPFNPLAIGFLEANNLLSPQPNAMPEIRSVRSTVSSPMTNTSSAQFSAPDPSSLSIDEILRSPTSEAKIDAVRMELEEVLSRRTEEDQPRCTGSYLQYLGKMNIDEISQFFPVDDDIASVISELIADPLPQSRAPSSTSPNRRVSQEINVPAASRALEEAPRVLAYNSPMSLSRLSFFDELLPVSNEYETMNLDYVINEKEQMFFIFKLGFKLQVGSREMKVRKVSFHTEDQTYVVTPAFMLYRKYKSLHLIILKRDLPSEGKYIVTILYSVNNVSKITKMVERNDTTLTSSLLCLKTAFKVTACNWVVKYNSGMKINDASGQ